MDAHKTYQKVTCEITNKPYNLKVIKVEVKKKI